MEKKHSFKELILNLKKKKFFVTLMLGISAGLPLMLVASTVKIWLRREDIDIKAIGYMSWLMMPWSFNFLWAPLLDNFFIQKFGRRRTWIMLAQLGMGISMFAISFTSPKTSILALAACAFGIAVSSATQDVAIDAYRREIMDDEEQGIGASLYVYGYRVGMLIASGFGLWIVDPDTWNFSFNQMFILMAVMAIALMGVTWWADEPQAEHIAEHKNFNTIIIEPFKEFLTRRLAFTVLFFVLFFKFGDGVAGSLYSTFYVDLGYSNKIIAEVTKGIGFFSTMAGLAVGASIIYVLGIFRSLIIFGTLQAVSTAMFAILPTFGVSWWGLAFIVAFEDFSSGLGTTAMVSFLSVMANRRYTATQYALLASLAAFGRTFFSGFAGHAIEYFKSFFATADEQAQLMGGYQVFFVFCAILAIPGLILAIRIIRNEKHINQHIAPKEKIEDELD
jgi:PAT family beta-lactamase induction signal transducer AmpG